MYLYYWRGYHDDHNRRYSWDNVNWKYQPTSCEIHIRLILRYQCRRCLDRRNCILYSNECLLQLERRVWLALPLTDLSPNRNYHDIIFTWIFPHCSCKIDLCDKYDVINSSIFSSISFLCIFDYLINNDIDRWS